MEKLDSACSLGGNVNRSLVDPEKVKDVEMTLSSNHLGSGFMLERTENGVWREDVQTHVRSTGAAHKGQEVEANSCYRGVNGSRKRGFHSMARYSALDRKESCPRRALRKAKGFAAMSKAPRAPGSHRREARAGTAARRLPRRGGASYPGFRVEEKSAYFLVAWRRPAPPPAVELAPTRRPPGRVHTAESLAPQRRQRLPCSHHGNQK